jgi:hypothetical protein
MLSRHATCDTLLEEVHAMLHGVEQLDNDTAALQQAGHARCFLHLIRGVQFKERYRRHTVPTVSPYIISILSHFQFLRCLCECLSLLLFVYKLTDEILFQRKSFYCVFVTEIQIRSVQTQLRSIYYTEQHVSTNHHQQQQGISHSTFVA